MQPATANKTEPQGCKAAGSYAPKRPAGQADTLCFAQGAGPPLHAKTRLRFAQWSPPRPDFSARHGASPSPRSSRQHRENCLNVVRCRSQQCIVTGLALRGRLQNELSHVRFAPRRCLVQRNFCHHLIKGCTHGLDEFWTVARHDTVSRLCGSTVAGLTPAGQTQSREWNHANVTFDFFLNS